MIKKKNWKKVECLLDQQKKKHEKKNNKGPTNEKGCENWMWKSKNPKVKCQHRTASTEN